MQRPGGTAAGRSADFAGAVSEQPRASSSSSTGPPPARPSRRPPATLTDVHDYVIAATQAQLATELTTTVRNKALDAFNEIMRMPL